MASIPPPGRWPVVRGALLAFIAMALVTYGVWMAVRLISLLEEREAAAEVMAAVPPTPEQPHPAVPLPVPSTSAETEPGGKIAASEAGEGVQPAGATAPPPPLAGKILLERTACYGFCPAYTVSITSGGRVHYEGKQFVRVHGGRDFAIDPKQARALFAQIEAARPFAMASRYFIGITDNPTATLTITLGGRTKSIEDYPPCHGSDFGTATPPQLCELEERVDELAGVADLVRCREDGASYCRSP